MAIGIATMGMYRWTGCTPVPPIPPEIGSGIGGIHIPPRTRCSITVERIRVDEEKTDKYIKVMAIRTKNGNGDE